MGEVVTDESESVAAESWAFALRLYAEPGVQEACLHLQECAGVDVMLLLVAVFAASRAHIHLHSEDVRMMDDASRPWREQVVRPLRALRRRLVTGPAPAPSAASEKLRSQIKGSELAAERLENDLLAAWLESKTPGEVRLSRTEVSDVVQTVVRHALGDEPALRTDGMSSSIDVIVDAVGRLAG
jgi:uncharacterized protein (TIGR02444 family)